MSLMKLAPESVRLRRIAKAFAAGEFSEEEYRTARREVISNFVPSPLDDDDTQPRLLDTQEQPLRRAPVRSGRGRLWLLIALALGALVAASGVLAGPVTRIPDVAERDPNPATSPRLEVNSVRVSNFQSLPGISSAEVQARVDNTLTTLRQRQQPGAHGFTPGELDELGRLLNALGAHEKSSELGPQDLADLQALIAAQKQRRGVSIVELEEVAEAVQALYRSAGYFLAVAYVPAQQVTGATVDIEVLPGVLGGVNVHGDGGALASRFDDLVGEALTEEVVTTRLYALNQAPGVKAQVSFEPGSQVGETELNLEVIPQKTWQGRLALDNYGAESTGKQRLLADASILNPTDRGDMINLGLLTSLQGADQVYGYLGYSVPVGSRTHVSSRLAYTRFEADLNNSLDGLDSDGWLFDVGLDRVLRQARDRGLAYQLGGGYHRLNWDGQAPDPEGAQDVFFVSAGVSTHNVWDRVRIAADASLKLDTGVIEGATFVGQDSRYWLLGMDAFAWHPLNVPVLPGEQKISAEFHGQLASSELPSSKRFSLGGNLAVRSFQRDTYLVDQGGMLRVDLRTPVAVGELSLFADAAYGETLNQDNGNWGYLSGVGLAWSLTVSNLESRLSWAYPLASDGSGGLEDDGSQIYWSFSYHR
jgi:hemolysin activation/secretion protein